MNVSTATARLPTGRLIRRRDLLILASNGSLANLCARSTAPLHREMILARCMGKANGCNVTNRQESGATTLG